MGKKDNGNRIVIVTGDEPPEANSTFYALLRDGEKIKPGDVRGTLLDRIGGEVQDFLSHQYSVANRRHAAVKGSVTITLNFVTGADGSIQYACEVKPKTAKMPVGMSMTFADEDGELTGRPVEPLTDLAYERERKAKQNVSDAEPKVGAASNL